MAKKMSKKEIDSFIKSTNITQEQYVAPTVQRHVDTRNVPAMAAVSQTVRHPQVQPVQQTVNTVTAPTTQTVKTKDLDLSPKNIGKAIGKAAKIAGKTIANVPTLMAEGALKTGESVIDTANDLSDAVNNFASYGAIKTIYGKNKADKWLKKEQKNQEQFIKRNLVNDFENLTGWSKEKNKWEKDSLINSENLGGQVVQGIGGMVPALLAGQYAGLTPNLTSLQGLSGAAKAKAIAGNIGQTYLSQLPSNAILSASSYGGGLEEALNDGATRGQARKYGLANAAIEQGTEMLTGGVPGLEGKGGLDSLIEPLVNRNTNGYLNALLKAGYGAAGEGLEEYAGAMLEPLAKKIYSDEKINWDEVRKQARQAGLVGAATGAILNSPQNLQDIRDVRNENRVRKAIGDAEYAEGNNQYNPDYKGWETQREENRQQEQLRKQEQEERNQKVAENNRLRQQEQQTQENNINATQKLENRVSGDKLLDAQDFINEVKDVGANVDDNGYVTVYHQTTPENAKKILNSGRMSSKEQAVFFSTSQNASQSDGRGSTKLEFKIPAEELELDDIFSDNADVKINLNGKKDIDVSKYLVGNNNIPVETPKLTQQENIQNQQIKNLEQEIRQEEKLVEPTIVAKNKNGQEIKLKQSKSSPGVYNQEAISKDIKDINNQYKNKVVKSKNGMEVSNFYSNITEKSQFIDTDIRNMFKNENDLQFYKKVSNEESLNKANKEIGNTVQSQQKAFDDFISKTDQFNSIDMAKGWILLERFNQARDYDRAYMVAKQMKEKGTQSGQAIQILNLQSRLTPEGMYKWAVSELINAENKFNSEPGRTKQEIEKYKDSFKLTPEETDFLIKQMEKAQSMPDGREKNIEIAKVNSMLQNKLPHKKGQSLKSWMRISMLLNPKTQVRNVAGNAIITPVNAISDVFASGVDKIVSKKTGKRTIGAPSLGGLAAYGKGAIQGVKEATSDYIMGIDTKNTSQDRFEIGQGKAFNEKHTGPLKEVRNAVSKVLNETNDFLGYIMDVGDRAFYKGSVENSLYNQQRINNTSEVTNEMIEIAENEGLQRTWNDNNEYTKAVLDLRRSINKIGDQMHLHIGEYGLGDLLIPFAKTPANLTKAIVDYSPVGFVNAITEGKNLKNAIDTGKYTPQMQHDFSQTIGKATAGTLLYALGSALAKANITTGNSDEDKDLKNFMRYNLGIQPYSIKIGDKSFTYDWAQPIAAPFAITADVEKGMQENMTPSQAVQHFLTTGFNILSEQSFLSGINEVLNDNDGILNGIEQQVVNIPSTAMPTFLKQITDLLDGTKRQTYSKEGQIENMKKTAMSKDPIGSKKLAPQVDVLGNEIEKYGGNNNWFNVFFNPANMEKGKESDVAKEIYSLYEATQDKTIIPRKVDYSTKINGENKILTTQEMEKWQKASGKLVTQEIERAMKNEDYKEMNNDEKAKVINKIVNYSYQKAKSDTFDTPLANTYNGVEKAKGKGIPIADYYISTVLKNSR